MKTVRLGAIAESLPCDYGDDPTDDAPGFDVVKVSNVSGEGQFHGDFEKRRFRDDQLTNLLVKEGELLVVKSSGSKANILSGKTAICGTDRAGRIVASNFLLRLRVDEDTAVPRFLWYVLNSGASKAFVKTIVGASTYPNLKWSLYASHPIPLPPLAEQRRIAAVLDRAEALRAKRRAALAQLDSLTQSIFLDLFGEPLTQQNGCETVEFDRLTTRITYGFTCPMEHISEGIPIITAKNVRQGFIDFQNCHCATEAQFEGLTDKCKPEEGDLLITKDGAIRGRCAVVNTRSRFCISQAVALIRPDRSAAIPEYLWGYIVSDRIQRKIMEMDKGVAMPHLQITELAKFPVFLSPLPLQREFARRVGAVEKLKTAQRASLSELDALFATLQHRAFRGEI